MKGPWITTQPLAHQSRRTKYEFDAVSVSVIMDRAKVHVAEVEVRCSKFLEYEKRQPPRTSIEGKVPGLSHLLETIQKPTKS